MHRLFIILLPLFLLPAFLAAAETDRPRVGLILSGGAAKGLAHIGVLQVIEEAGLEVDIVTGTSMGAIVGGLYSIGYTPDEIADIVRDTDWNVLFSDRSRRRETSMLLKPYESRFLVSLPVRDFKVDLPSGMITGQRAMAMLTQLTWPVHHIHDFSEFPRSFACVATDVETGEAVRLTDGFLPEAIRASFSIPSIFQPVTIEGRTLIDGYVARNLPAEDAEELG
ncbi:hypothetical protein GF324_01660, partial [bacterium]|nr:hypothetical protein [bacterium]